MRWGLQEVRAQWDPPASSNAGKCEDDKDGGGILPSSSWARSSEGRWWWWDSAESPPRWVQTSLREELHPPTSHLILLFATLLTLSAMVMVAAAFARATATGSVFLVVYEVVGMRKREMRLKTYQIQRIPRHCAGHSSCLWPQGITLALSGFLMPSSVLNEGTLGLCYDVHRQTPCGMVYVRRSWMGQPNSSGWGKRWYHKGMACCQVVAQGPGTSSTTGGNVLALCQRKGWAMHVLMLF